MQLACDLSVASAYKSPSQRARVISETWFSQNIYCLACESNCVARTTPNTRATDFLCKTCGHRYELKTFTKRPPRSLVDGAYASLIARVNASTAPTLCLLGRSESWQVQSLIAIHSSFLTPWVIERRSPLSQNARRAGWVGCNIRLDRIPPDGEIAVISEGVCLPKSEVRRRFERFLPLANLSADQRGWTTLTLSIIRIAREKQVRAIRFIRAGSRSSPRRIPEISHVRAKIRQQLQVLRDLGVLTFEGRGQYLLLN